jgi:hypothetical protein
MYLNVQRNAMMSNADVNQSHGSSDCKFKCICCHVVQFGILSQIYITSEVLQGVNLNLTHAPNQPNIFRIIEQIKHLNSF